MADCRVVNASPLITLAKVGQLALLEEPECVLVIPAPVAQQVLRWPAEDLARKALAGGWGGTPIPVEPDADIMEWGLGPGESGVMTLARSMNGVAVIDDGAARRCAGPRSALDRDARSGAPGRAAGTHRLGRRDPGAVGRCRLTVEQRCRSGRLGAGHRGGLAKTMNRA